MSCVFIFGGQISKAQLVRQKSESVKSQANLDWYNCSPEKDGIWGADINSCLLYTSPSPRDSTSSRMPSSA